MLTQPVKDIGYTCQTLQVGLVLTTLAVNYPPDRITTNSVGATQPHFV